MRFVLPILRLVWRSRRSRRHSTIPLVIRRSTCLNGSTCLARLWPAFHNVFRLTASIGIVAEFEILPRIRP